MTDQKTKHFEIAEGKADSWGNINNWFVIACATWAAIMLFVDDPYQPSTPNAKARAVAFANKLNESISE